MRLHNEHIYHVISQMINKAGGLFFADHLCDDVQLQVFIGNPAFDGLSVEL